VNPGKFFSIKKAVILCNQLQHPRVAKSTNKFAPCYCIHNLCSVENVVGAFELCLVCNANASSRGRLRSRHTRRRCPMPYAAGNFFLFITSPAQQSVIHQGVLPSQSRQQKHPLGKVLPPPESPRKTFHHCHRVVRDFNPINPSWKNSWMRPLSKMPFRPSP